MKRFSEGLPEDREFEVADQVFRWEYPHWEEVWSMFDQDAARLAELAKTREDGDESVPTNVKSISDLIERIGIFIHPDDRERWVDLCSNGKGRHVPYGQFVAIYEWLLEVTSGRPTSAPSPSSAGAEESESTSVAA